jgi:hypothetical protein
MELEFEYHLKNHQYLHLTNLVYQDKKFHSELHRNFKNHPKVMENQELIYQEQY